MSSIDKEISYQKYKNNKNNNNTIKRNNVNLRLTQQEKDSIINIIKENFIIFHGYDENSINDDFLNKELSIVVKHVKIKHSHHMDCLYTNDNYSKIKSIVGKKIL